ncbi:MAG: hypothetical protein WA152_01305 [Microgenomates group bacterium]
MRRARLQKQQSRKSIVPILITSTLLVVLTFILVTFFIKLSNLPKFSYVNKHSDGGAEVVVVDSKSDKLIKYKIEPQTVLNSARGFGEYKLESLWVLGQKEGMGGKLVAESIASNYLAPIYLWDDGQNSNLNIYQKIKTKLLKIENVETSGIWDTFELHNSVLINFIDDNIQEKSIVVEVEDLTGSQSVINKVSSIVGTLGTKVSGYNKGYEENYDCSITTKSREIGLIFANVFDCVVSSDKASDVVKIKLGAKFADRF